MAKDYFQTDEFNELLEMYERQKKKRKSIYLDAEDFADIADYYLGNDMPLAAMEAVDMGLAIHQGSDVLLIMKSAVYIYQFQFKEAEALLAELDESNTDVLYQLAQLQYAYYLDTEKAEEMWRQWLQMDCENEGSSDEYRRENYIHIISTLAVLRDPHSSPEKRRADADALVRWVREYIDTFKPLGKSDSDLQLADICRENELPDLLAEVLSQVLEERPYLPKGWSTLALAHYILMDFEQTLDACAFALAINPNDMDALLTKAYAVYEVGDREGAKPIFKEYVDKGGEAVQILPYVEMLFRDADLQEAMAQLGWLTQRFEDRKEELKRQMDSASRQLSDIEYRKASRAYEDFMELYRKTQNDIGDIYYRNERYEESCRAYARLVEAGNNSSDIYFMIGLNHLALDRFHEAVCSFGLALSNAEDKVMTGIDIALTFAINNYDEFALKVLEAVDDLAASEDNPSAKNIAAAKSLAYLKMGDTEQFLAFFKRACEDTPDLIRKVYDNYFPTDLPISEWHDYAQREIQTLLKKISKEDVHIAGF